MRGLTEPMIIAPIHAHWNITESAESESRKTAMESIISKQKTVLKLTRLQYVMRPI